MCEEQLSRRAADETCLPDDETSMPAFAYRIPVSSLPVVRGKDFFSPPACHHWPPVLCSSLLLQPVRTDSLYHFSSNKDSFFWWSISLKEVFHLNCLVEVHICPSEVSPDELCSRIWPLTSSSCILSDICPALSMFLGVAETLVYVLSTSFKRQSLIKKKRVLDVLNMSSSHLSEDMKTKLSSEYFFIQKKWRECELRALSCSLIKGGGIALCNSPAHIWEVNL